MTRNQHYVRAAQLLKEVEEAEAGWVDIGSDLANRTKLEVARIHALLAGVPAKVAGE